MRCFRKIFSYIRASTSGDRKKWNVSEGKAFIKKMGVCEGDTIIDFGSRSGNYTIPAAIMVGTQGVVYAIEKNRKASERLQKKANTLGLKNIKTILSSGGVNIELKDKSANFVMTYDVLHMMEQGVRRKLYGEIYRVLKEDGVFSVYPKHIASDIPSRYFKDIQAEDVKHEIEQAAFICKSQMNGIVNHDNNLINGCVFNFRKEEKEKD